MQPKIAGIIHRFHLIMVMIPIISIAQQSGYIYFVPLPESQIHTAFLMLYPPTRTTYHTVISVVPSVTSTTEDPVTVIYDHWEDGYETNISAPVQPTTWIFGDGNPANNGPFTDEVTAGQALVLENDLTVPRNPSIIKADGMDKFMCIRSLSCARSSWALNPGTVLADAVEFSDTKTYGTSYIIPIGQNTPSDGMFNLVALHVQAAENSTQILIDRDGDGITDISTVINQGESYQLSSQIMQSATVQSGKPVQVVLITGMPGERYESRWYTIYPSGLWNKGYWSPVSTTTALASSHVFIYNPTTSVLPVTIHTKTNTTGNIVNILPKGVYRYVMPSGTSAYFSNPSNNFYAIGAMDADASNHSTWDWGYSLIPEKSLTTSFFVGWGTGAFNSPSQNGSPVWVGAASLSDHTTIHIDFDGDPLTGSKTDINGNNYDSSITIPPLGSVRLYDPDNDQTGMHVYTLGETEIFGAWGEDGSRALAGNPFLDVGTSVVPQPVLRVWKSGSLLTDHNDNGYVDAGDVVKWKILLYNQTRETFSGINIRDTLAEGTSYLPATAKYGGTEIPDNPVPGTPFPLDSEGFNIVHLPGGVLDSLTFQVVIDTIAAGTDHIRNKVTVADDHQDIHIAEAQVPVYLPGITSCSLSFTETPGGTPTSVFQPGQEIHMKLNDGDQNVNPIVRDQVLVTLRNITLPDVETVVLMETAINSGIFTGSAASSVSLGTGTEDGILHAVPGNTIQVTYRDLLYGGTCETSAGIVFPTVRKPLYLSDSANTGRTLLDRIDPVNTADPTTSLSSVLSASGGSVNITAVNTTSGSTTSGSTLTFTHSSGNSLNRFLVVGVTVGGTTNSTGGGVINSVTYGGVPLVQAGAQVIRGSARCGLFYLVNPAPGPTDIVITVASASSIGAGATTFSGVNQSTPVGSYYSRSMLNTPTASITTIVSASNELVYSVSAFDEGTVNQSIIAGTGQTELWNLGGLNYISGAASTKPGEAITTVSYTQGDPSPQEWVIAAIPMKPAVIAANTSVEYLQNPRMCQALTLQADGLVKVKLWLTGINGIMPPSPAITCELKSGLSSILTLTNPVFTDNPGTANDTLVFTGIIPPAATVPANGEFRLTIHTQVSGVSFQISYDSQSSPSVAELPVTSFLAMENPMVYNAPWPGGAPVSGGYNGQTVWVRTTVTDPFGASDIDPATPARLVILLPSGATDTVTMNLIHTPNCGKVYEYPWITPAGKGVCTLTAISKEGYENSVSVSRSTTFDLSFFDNGTPCHIVFTESSNGAPTTVFTGSLSFNLCIRVNDMDQNISLARDTVRVTVISDGAGHDQEIVILTETENQTGSGIFNTGVFTGCLNASTVTGSGTGNGILRAPEGTALTAVFTDPKNTPDQCTANAMVTTPGTTHAVLTKTLVYPENGVASVGDSVTWRLVISNTGQVPLTDVQLTDQWNPACLGFISSTPAPTSQVPSGTLLWQTASLNGPILPGTNRAIYIRYSVVSGCGPTTNSASLGGTFSTGTVTSSILLTDPGLTIRKTVISPVTPPPVYAGATVIYRIAVSNSGNTAIDSLPLTDQYSMADLSFVSATPPATFAAGGQAGWDDLLPGTQILEPGDSLEVMVNFLARKGNYPFAVRNLAQTGNGAKDMYHTVVPVVSDDADIVILSIPVANPDEYTMTGNISGISNTLNGQVMFNDQSPDGFSLTVDTSAITGPVHAASFTIHPDGTFSYVPTDGFSGDDHFTYRLCDINGYCVSATVTIHVLPCSSAPARPGSIKNN